MWTTSRLVLKGSPLWIILSPRASRIVSTRAFSSRQRNQPKQSSPSQPDDPGTSRGLRTNSTANLIPSSKRILVDETAQAEYDKASSKMSAAVDWFRKEVAGLEARGTGRITPAILDPVKVIIPGAASEVQLQEVATVGVREGANLVVTLFEEDNLKYVEKAIYAAKLHNIIPQKVDPQTLKIAIPRLTMEARATLLNKASHTAEDTRVQIRKTRDASVRKHKWKPRSDEIEQFQKLCDTRVKEVDQILAKAKKELGV